MVLRDATLETVVDLRRRTGEVSRRYRYILKREALELVKLCKFDALGETVCLNNSAWGIKEAIFTEARLTFNLHVVEHMLQSFVFCSRGWPQLQRTRGADRGVAGSCGEVESCSAMLEQRNGNHCGQCLRCFSES